MQRSHKLPEGLGESVRAELERLGSPVHGRGLAEVVSAWPAAVGPSIARNAWPARIARDGTVLIHTASSAWAQELTHLETEIRSRLASSVLPSQRLRFAVGPVPEPDAAVAPVVSQSVHTPEAGDRRAAAEIALTIEAPGLRESVAQAVAMSLAAARARGHDRPV